MSDYWSGQINFAGLGSGTDFNAIVDQLVKIDSYRLDQMEESKSSYETQQDAIRQLNSAMLDLQTALEKLDTPGEFMAKTAESGDPDAVSVTAGSEAAEGTHNIVVNQLAQNDIWVNYAQGYADTSAILTDTDASLTFSYAGTGHTIDVPAGTTLAGLTNLINNDPDLKGDVRATAVSDGSQYYLQLKGMDLGAGNTVQVTGSTIAGLNAADFVNTQTAQNAQVKVDGFPPGGGNWIESDTNVLEDAIEGLTLTLKDTTGADGTQISVTTDTEAIVENVAAFVQEVNNVLSLIEELTRVEGGDEDIATYDDDEDEDGEDSVTPSVLTGNYGVDIIEQNLKSILSGKGLGFNYYDADAATGDLFSSLSQVGISTDAQEDSPTFGQLLIDEEKLREALDTDPDAVAMLFSADSYGESVSPGVTFNSLIRGTTAPGSYEIEYEVAGGTLISATINGVEAKIDGWNILATDGPGTGMSLRVDDTSDGPHTAQVNVKQGKAGQLLDELDEITEPLTGSLAIIEQGFQNNIDSLEDQIANEEARLSTKESTLIAKYARLEATLVQYQGVQAQLESSLASLG